MSMSLQTLRLKMKAVHFPLFVYYSVFTLSIIGAVIDDEEVNKGVRKTVTEAVVGDCTPIFIFAGI